jgi:hypothetical protein
MEPRYVRDKEEHKREDGISSTRISKLKEAIGTKSVVARVGRRFFARITSASTVAAAWRARHLLPQHGFYSSAGPEASDSYWYVHQLHIVHNILC